MSVRLEVIGRSGLDPALKMLPPAMDTERARVMLCAISLQESRCVHRRQIGNGPARGLLQFEEGGGVRGVMRHEATRALAREICEKRKVVFEPNTVWRALETDDVLAFAFGRLLLYSDPKPLPGLSQPPLAWAYYLRTWRPGKPHEQTWGMFHFEAVNFVMNGVV